MVVVFYEMKMVVGFYSCEVDFVFVDVFLVKVDKLLVGGLWCNFIELVNNDIKIIREV